LRGFAEYFEPARKGLPGVVTVTEVGPTLRSDALREAWKERWGPAEVKDAKRKKAMEAHLFLKDEQVYNTATRVHIELSVDDQKIRAAASITNKKKKMTLERLEKILGISEIVSTTNMHLFDANMAMKRFATPEAILEHFFRHRLRAYHRRKAHQVAEMESRVIELQNKARYCTMIHDGALSVIRKTVAEREADLDAANFTRILPKPKAADAATGRVEQEGDEDEERAVKEEEAAVSEEGKSDRGDVGPAAAEVLPSIGYEYLLRIATLSCTTEHARRLRLEADKLQAQLLVSLSLSLARSLSLLSLSPSLFLSHFTLPLSRTLSHSLVHSHSLTHTHAHTHPPPGVTKHATSGHVVAGLRRV